jgi:hypothetical protein
MKIVIHQPHFLPWIGYFNKINFADIFVVQDNVQYRKEYFQNRTIIQQSNGNSSWVTLPVHYSTRTKIHEVEIVSEKEKRKVVRKIEAAYKKSEYFSLIWPTIKEGLLNNGNRLLDVNMATLKILFSMLKISVDILYGSKFNGDEDPADRLVNICRELNAKIFVFGEGGGLDYHGYAKFHKNGITTLRQNYLEFITGYTVKNEFIPHNLSIIHFLFNLGIEQTINLIKRNGEFVKISG